MKVRSSGTTFGSGSSLRQLVQLVEDDLGAVLTPAHPAAELGGLAVGEPAVEGIAAGSARQGEQDDVDAAVGAVGGGVDREGIGLPGPGTDPGCNTRLEGGDDAIGDFAIEISLHDRAPEMTKPRGAQRSPGPREEKVKRTRP